MPISTELYAPLLFLSQQEAKGLELELVELASDRYADHVNRDWYRENGALRDGRTLHLRRLFYRDDSKAAVDINELPEYPRTTDLLESIDSTHGRVYAHMLPKGKRIYRHRDHYDDGDNYFRYAFTRHLLFLRGSGVFMLDDCPVPTPLHIVCSFDPTHYHDFEALEDWYFLVFDIMHKALEIEPINRLDPPGSH